MRSLLFLVLIALILQSCGKEEISSRENNIDHIFFEVERLQTDNNYVSSVVEVNSVSRSSYWYDRKSEESPVRLQNEIILDLKLENGLDVSFALTYWGQETEKDLLILESDGRIGSGNEWDYLESKEEISRFYENPDNARIGIDQTLNHNCCDESEFNLRGAREVIVDGIAKTYVEIEFSGDFSGAYDPTGEYAGSYKISNGVFRGVVE